MPERIGKGWVLGVPYITRDAEREGGGGEGSRTSWREVGGGFHTSCARDMGWGRGKGGRGGPAFREGCMSSGKRGKGGGGPYLARNREWEEGEVHSHPRSDHFFFLVREYFGPKASHAEGCGVGAVVCACYVLVTR